jgi:very-short-patch-repair endonuclease
MKNINQIETAKSASHVTESQEPNYLSVILNRQESESPGDYLWRQLQCGRLNGLHFRRNDMVDGVPAPFVCRFSRLVVEIDPPKKQNETDRIQHFMNHGMNVIEVESEQLFSSPTTILNNIRKAAAKPKKNALNK